MEQALESLGATINFVVRIDVECTAENEPQVLDILKANQYVVMYRCVEKDGTISLRAE